MTPRAPASKKRRICSCDSGPVKMGMSGSFEICHRSTTPAVALAIAAHAAS